MRCPPGGGRRAVRWLTPPTTGGTRPVGKTTEPRGGSGHVGRQKTGTPSIRPGHGSGGAGSSGIRGPQLLPGSGGGGGRPAGRAVEDDRPVPVGPAGARLHRLPEVT